MMASLIPWLVYSDCMSENVTLTRGLLGGYSSPVYVYQKYDNLYTIQMLQSINALLNLQGV